MRECRRIFYIPRDFLRSHAATAVKSNERERLEKLVRYMARPAIAEERISVLSNGDIKLKLKTPWRDGSVLRNQVPTKAGGVAAETMRVGPAKSAIRCWLQTATSGSGQKPRS